MLWKCLLLFLGTVFCPLDEISALQHVSVLQCLSGARVWEELTLYTFPAGCLTTINWVMLIGSVSGRPLKKTENTFIL